MSLFGKNLSDYLSFVRAGLLAMGVLRFIVGFSGVLYDRATDLVSMTIVTVLIYGQRAKARGTNYFHESGQGFQPAELSQAQHVRGHFQVSIVVTVFLSILAIAGFAVGKRKAPAPAAA